MATPPIVTLTEAELRRAAGGGLMSAFRNALAAAQQSSGEGLRITLSDILVSN